MGEPVGGNRRCVPLGVGKTALHAAPKTLMLGMRALSQWLREWAPPLVAHSRMAMFLRCTGTCYVHMFFLSACLWLRSRWPPSAVTYRHTDIHLFCGSPGGRSTVGARLVQSVAHLPTTARIYLSVLGQGARKVKVMIARAPAAACSQASIFVWLSRVHSKVSQPAVEYLSLGNCRLLPFTVAKCRNDDPHGTVLNMQL